MAPQRSPGSPWAAVLAAVPPLLAALLVIIWDVTRSAPQGYECGEGTPPGQEAALATFRDGSVTWHAIAMLCCGVLLVLSAQRRRGEHRGLQAIGLPTLLGVCVVVLVLPFALDTPAGILLGLLSALIGAPGLLLAHPGAGAPALLAAAGLLVAAPVAWLAVTDGHVKRVAVGVWWLIAFAGGHLLLVQGQGIGPLVC